MIPVYIPYEWYELTPQQQRDLLEEMALQRMLDKHHAQRDYRARQFSPPAASVAAPSLVVAGVAGNLIGEIA